MRRILLLVILISLLLIPATTTAQTDKAKCDPSKVIDAANTLKSTGDSQQDLQALLTLQNQISAANIACNGLAFEGKTKTVIDPFILPKGTYKAVATSKGYLSVQIKTFDGDCGVYDTFLFSVTEAADGAEDLLDLTSDCRLSLMIDTNGDPWTVTIEPFGVEAAVIASPEKQDTPKPTTAPTKTTPPTKTPLPTKTVSDVGATRTQAAKAKVITATFVGGYKPINRKELVAYADDHKGEKVVVKGRIFNINSRTEFQMYIQGSNDAVYIRLRKPMSEIYENDFVTVYGIVFGEISFENSFGTTISQPAIDEAVVTKP